MATPSVTTVLGMFSDFSAIRPEVLQHAAGRGTAVHHAIAIHLAGGFACPSAGAQGYFNSACRWIDQMIDEVILMETRLHCDTYHGKPDLIARLKGGTIALIDWKTPAQPSKTWPIQIAAYRNLPGALGVTRGMCIRLKKDGTSPLVNEYTQHQQDLNNFNACLTVYNLFFRDRKPEEPQNKEE